MIEIENASAAGRKHLAMASQPMFSLRRRLQLCLVMLALESFISFEEIFMVSVLQRVRVPTFLVSMPGTASSLIGVFVIPILGWASDRFTSPFCGQKRPFATFTLTVCIVGTSLLVGVMASTLYADRVREYSSTRANTTDLPLLTGISSGGDDLRSMKNSNGTTTFPASAITRGSHLLSSEPNFNSASSELQYNKSKPSNGTATPASVDNSSLATPESSYVPALGILAMIAFTMADHGYDSSFSTLKSYMIAVTPESQHDDIFHMGTLTGAVGGCLTSLLGFVDLAAIFFPADDGSVDKGIAQCLVQAAILLASLVLFGALSLSTGSEKPTLENSVAFSVANHEASIINHKQNKDEESPLPSGAVIDSQTEDTDGKRKPQETVKENDEARSKVTCTENDNYIYNDEKTTLLDNTSTTKRDRVKKRVLLSTMTFLSLSANYAYFIYVTNYVAEVIFDGDPHDDVGSDKYQNYLYGEHIASLGMLTFYCLFVVFNLFHHKIVSKIGMKAEYIGSSLACCVLMFILAWTNNIVVFFANAATMAVFRSAVYTIPYILSNKYSKEEQKEDSTNGQASPDSKNSGTSMAFVAAMIPASYFLVSLLMGPLIAATGNASTPVVFAGASCLLGFVSTLFVHF